MSAPRTGAALGQAIRRLRRARRLTIEDLAYSAGIHATYLSSIERGFRNPTWGKVQQLAEALGMSLAALAKLAEEEAIIERLTTAARERLRAQSDTLDTSPTTRQRSP